MKDFRGLELKVGDRIAYATSSSNNVSIIEGEIVEVIEPTKRGDEGLLRVKTDQGWSYNIHNKKEEQIKIVKIYRTSRVAKLENTGMPLATRRY